MGQELQDSHFLPKAAYKLTRDESQRNPEPVRLNRGRITQDSRQITGFLLCKECEQRLNEKGERWFLAHCWRSERRFRLHSLLEKARPLSNSPPDIRVYHASQIPGINVNALIHFSAGMYWKASVHRWQECGGITLGPYEEQLRRFLLGESAFPKNCVLWVSLPETITPFVNLSLVPYGGRADRHFRYKLVLRGIAFDFHVGRQIPNGLYDTCFVHGPGSPIYKTDELEKGILQDVNRMFELHPRLVNGPRGLLSHRRTK